MVSHRNRDGAGAFNGDCKCGARRIDSQVGLEPSPDAYVATMVEVFREVRRVLRDDGTLWLNLGDSYASAWACKRRNGMSEGSPDESVQRGRVGEGLKEKDLCGIPWRVAFALQADGWYLRQDIIWSKPNPMPESVTDRCTKSHEYIFLLSKSARYFYDANAIAEPGVNRASGTNHGAEGMCDGYDGHRTRANLASGIEAKERRNKRSVWEVATAPFSEAHFATFPPALIEPCILAGCPEKCCAKCGAPWVRQTEVERRPTRPGVIQKGAPDRKDGGIPFRPETIVTTLGFSPSCSCNAGTFPGTVLDPFGGAGTTGLVPDRLGRNAILIELNPKYAAMAEQRITKDGPLFADVTSALDSPAITDL